MRRKCCIPRNVVQAVSIQAGMGWGLAPSPSPVQNPGFQAGQWCSLWEGLFQAGELLAATGNS